MNASLSTFGWVHTGLSVIALLSGIVVVAGILYSRRMARLTALFLASAFATSATAFGFGGFGPAQWIGVASLALIAIAIAARYAFHLAGAWRSIYAVAAVFTLYFLVFVTIAEAFKRIPLLARTAPTLTETPFKLTQLVSLLLFVGLASFAARHFRYHRAVNQPT